MIDGAAVAGAAVFDIPGLVGDHEGKITVFPGRHLIGRRVAGEGGRERRFGAGVGPLLLRNGRRGRGKIEAERSVTLSR